MKWSITTQERNALVESHLGCIWWTINKNRRLIAAADLDDDDVFQQLAVRMIRAIQNYDPDKGKDLEQHIFAQLQYEILNCKDAAKRYGLKGAPMERGTWSCPWKPWRTPGSSLRGGT